MKKFRHFPKVLTFFLALSCLALAPQALAQYDDGQTSVIIDISKGVTKYNIAVNDLVSIQPGRATGENGRKLPQRLRANLDMTGIFNNLDPRSFLESQPRAGIDPDMPINYAPWSQIGANFVIKGGMEEKGSSLTLEMRLFDVATGRQMLGKRYSGSAKDSRKMINQFTNAVIEAITGTPGVFGSKIIFVTGDNRSNRSVMMTELGSDEVESLAGSKGGPSSQPTMGPGNKAAWIHRNGKNYELLVDGKVISSGELHLSPAFRSDGSVAAAVSGPTSTNIYSFSGKSKSPVTQVGGIAVSPSFSPDGRMVYASDQGGSVQLYINGARLTSGSKSTDPAWSPKGDLITFVSRETDVCIIRPDGGGMYQLTGGQGVNLRPSFSPDGRMIVFSSTRRGKPELFVMGSNGQNPTPILPDYNGAQYTPYWSPTMPE